MMPARFNKDPDAILVGSLGCEAGGYERGKQLHPLHLSHIGRHGARTRWEADYTKSYTKPRYASNK